MLRYEITLFTQKKSQKSSRACLLCILYQFYLKKKAHNMFVWIMRFLAKIGITNITNTLSSFLGPVSGERAFIHQPYYPLTNFMNTEFNGVIQIPSMVVLLVTWSLCEHIFVSKNISIILGTSATTYKILLCFRWPLVSQLAKRAHQF